MRSRTRRGCADDVDAVDASIAAGRRREQPDQHADRRALARAVGAEEREDRAAARPRGRGASTAVKSPKRLRQAARGDDRVRSSRSAPDAAQRRASVASMSIAACSASCTPSGSARRSREHARAPGVARARGTSTRASARWRARRPRTAARARARDGARIVAPGAIELDGEPGAQLRRRADGDDAPAVEIDQPLAGLDLVEIARADQDQRSRSRALEQIARSRRARRRRRPPSARRAAAAPARAAARSSIASFCFMPPESAPPAASAKRREPGAREQLVRAPAPNPPRAAGAAAR